VICEQVASVLPWWEGFAADFEKLGYSTWTGVLSAEQFGVPQTRKRAFLLASLDGPVAAPQPTHEKYYSRKPHTRPELGLEPYVTMADVIDIDNTDLVGFPRRDDGAESIGGMRRRDLRLGDQPAHTMTSKGRSWKINTGRDWKPGGDRSTAQQRDGDAPAPTVTSSSTDKWWLLGRDTDRMITVQDGLALQTFPTDCLDGIEVTKTAAFKAIGNAVPPLWAKQIAQHLTKGAT
jgi:DNA (cytosine-5)-methyltransferase 1